MVVFMGPNNWKESGLSIKLIESPERMNPQNLQKMYMYKATAVVVT